VFWCGLHLLGCRSQLLHRCRVRCLIHLFHRHVSTRIASRCQSGTDSSGGEKVCFIVDRSHRQSLLSIASVCLKPICRASDDGDSSPAGQAAAVWILQTRSEDHATCPTRRSVDDEKSSWSDSVSESCVRTSHVSHVRSGVARSRALPAAAGIGPSPVPAGLS